MATAGQMMLVGIAFLVNTFVLIVSAIWGGAIWKPLMTWFYSVPYVKPPPLDPGMVTWIPSLYYGVLIACWFALLFAMIYMTFNRTDYRFGSV